MSNDILVFAEVRDGKPKGIVRELISVAGELASKTGGAVNVAVVGHGIDAVAREIAGYPVAKVFTVDDATLERYCTQGYSRALKAVIEQAKPVGVFFGATAMGKDLSARVAAAVGGALATDCTELAMADGTLRVKRPVYSGKAYAEVSFKQDRIQLVSIRPNIYPPAAVTGNSAEVVPVSASLDAGSITALVKEVVGTTAGRKDVTEAEIIVSGGRALKSEENFKILEELADVLGASVGASRAAVDAGYAPHSRQVGQTGKVVNPKLYFAIGISGAIQHLVGMRTSKVIVAINKDPNAPIFQYADYGIVGDLFEMVPLLTAEFKKLLSS